MVNKNIILAVAGFAIGLGAILLYKSAPPSAKLPSLILPTPTPVTMQLPSQATPASLSAYLGQVDRIPWDKIDTESAASSSALYQGDELITQIKSTASLTLINLVNISMQENSDLLLASLVPSRLALRQRSGTIGYVLTSATPLNIVAGRSLIKINSGQINIAYLNKLIEIELASGSATLAYNDNANVTKIWQLDQSTLVTTNDVTGQVKLTNRP